VPKEYLVVFWHKTKRTTGGDFMKTKVKIKVIWKEGLGKRSANAQ
jgi:hypothetical protein